MTDPLFSLHDVRFRDILDIPYLEIPGGKVTCIVGRSGSGKTTLMKLFNRMVTPDAGTIHFEGTPITDIEPIQLRRRVVMLAQTPVMFEGTVRDNLEIGLRFAGKPLLDDEDLRQLLSVMDLNKDLNEDASSLSGGEKQRVAFARVLAMRPEVALLDEPSSALDEGTERTIIDRVVSGAQEYGITLVIVTHARALAERIADWLIELEAGSVVSTSRAAS